MKKTSKRRQKEIASFFLQEALDLRDLTGRIGSVDQYLQASLLVTKARIKLLDIK